MFVATGRRTQEQQGVLESLVEVGLCSAFWSLTSIFGVGGVLTPKLEKPLTCEKGGKIINLKTVTLPTVILTLFA